MHVVSMVLTLAAFGPLLEQSARAVDVIAVYLLYGLAGSLRILAAITAFPAWAEDGRIVGSSAAVFGATAAVLAMRPSSPLFGGTTTQWLGALIAVNIVFLFSLPFGSIRHLAGTAVGVDVRAMAQHEIPNHMPRR